MNGTEPFPQLLVRPMRADDEVRLLRTAGRLSPRTVYQRFFSPIHTIPPTLLHRLANVDHDDREALVALDGDEIIAVVRWDRDPSDRDEAEVAALVEDAWQRRGLGAALTRMLIDEAVGRHIARLTATVLSDNTAVTKMLLATVGSPAEVRRYGPETRLTFALAG
jgi:RimJ/RimL family protein N-acetyltransferase